MIVNGALASAFAPEVPPGADRPRTLPVRQADHGSRSDADSPARRIYFALQLRLYRGRGGTGRAGMSAGPGHLIAAFKSATSLTSALAREILDRVPWRRSEADDCYGALKLARRIIRHEDTVLGRLPATQLPASVACQAADHDAIGSTSCRARCAAESCLPGTSSATIAACAMQEADVFHRANGALRSGAAGHARSTMCKRGGGQPPAMADRAGAWLQDPAERGCRPHVRAIDPVSVGRCGAAGDATGPNAGPRLPDRGQRQRGRRARGVAPG